MKKITKDPFFLFLFLAFFGWLALKFGSVDEFVVFALAILVANQIAMSYRK